MTPQQAVRFISRNGVVLESARGPVPNLLEAALGRRPQGSWWGAPEGKSFFRLTRAVRARPDILVCRLVDGKVTYVHRRLWPALARLQRRFKASALAAIVEVHTASGTHRTALTAFRRRLPRGVAAAASRLTVEEAGAALGPVMGDWARRKQAFGTA
jgi:hypothetical protein